jgi:hypothetical protein
MLNMKVYYITYCWICVVSYAGRLSHIPIPRGVQGDPARIHPLIRGACGDNRALIFFLVTCIISANGFGPL